ncbi:NosR/NirI family transcriptional regulator, nitrous oxide reductase regulator [Enhydrobacter aerosaccus]|uniref:NosR/NirI family transcriptional regulator, nitrous oxide reductase regulator n=1 Tax=Enhydrobacter aerosaccus TaxID=225324 RepID=A0A1T4SUM1_9HYPH|nr:NosR/NirI family protein [Enhydrobacter aerosaccus]SKA31975.1 NosR/NirI family transcriptional regulator, nitrous oxide reductase regulator [Enhydrobacter aerosaccus]
MRALKIDTAVAALLALLACCVCLCPPAKAQSSHLAQYLQSAPLADIFPGADHLGPIEGKLPATAAYNGSTLLGYVFLNADIVNATGYSGRPINIVIGIDLSGKIVGAKLVEHHEPIVLIGIPVQKVENFIHGYVGLNFLQMPSVTSGGPPVDIVSGATVTMMVIGDTITKSSIQIARSRGLGNAATAREPATPSVIKKVDPNKGGAEDWNVLLGDGSVRRLAVSVGEINEAFAHSGNAKAADYPQEGAADDSFVDLYVAEASVPAIGRSLLGDSEYEQLRQRLSPGQQAILVAGNGIYSFKGSGYVRGGIFDRIELVQGENIIRFRDRNHRRIGDIAAAGAPDFREIGIFAIPHRETFDPAQPWRLKLLVQRTMGARDKAFLTYDVAYTLPDKYLSIETPAAAIPAAAPMPSTNATGTTPAKAEQTDRLDEALWLRMWRGRIPEIATLLVALAALTGIFFFQDALVRRPVLYDRVRLGFLVFTLVWIGWYAQAQLSVVNVLTFANALRTDFRWDYFLMDPLIFILWAAVAASLLFWGRGAFCGWLCPFGALQELLNRLARLLRIPQYTVPFGIHQRLWPIKYIVFLVLFGLSLYSLSLSEQASEVEPFKTAIVLRFARDWPFVLFAVVLLTAGLFIERFFCRYLCPLGAALAIPARLRMFDWLRRYRECGNPCQRCAHECPVQSIHPEGNINPNECIQCLHCQMLYHHAYKCPVVIQRRLRREKRLAITSPSMRGSSPSVR